MKTVEEINREIEEFESQFSVDWPAAGTPNRKRLYREAHERAHAEACRPENIAKRKELHAMRSKARRSEKAKEAAARRAADPSHKLRQIIFRHLRKMGFSRDHVSGKSAYYSVGLFSVRVSDHAVPWSPEREYNRSNGGHTWSNSAWSFEIDDSTHVIEALRWLVEVRRHLAAKR